jgi:hypothetical protein
MNSPQGRREAGEIGIGRNPFTTTFDRYSRMGRIRNNLSS